MFIFSSAFYDRLSPLEFIYLAFFFHAPSYRKATVLHFEVAPAEIRMIWYKLLFLQWLGTQLCN